MRIISGQHKGRKISAPKQLPIRPTTDMAKEALFNIINNQYYLDELMSWTYSRVVGIFLMNLPQGVLLLLLQWKFTQGVSSLSVRWQKN